jgi:tetratricopeptide (TPR) repeat protein
MLQAAAFLFTDVLKQDPGNHLALLDFGSMYLGRNILPQAQELIGKAQTLYPADGETYHLLGHLAIQAAKSLADAERARRLFELAIRLDPLNEEALYDAACGAALPDPNRALDELQASVKAGFRDFAHMARDGDLDPIRKDPRFGKITEGKAVAPPPSSKPQSPSSKPQAPPARP